MPKPALPEMMHFRMSRADARKLGRLAKHYQRTASDVLRRLIADETERLDLVLQKPKET